MRKFFDSDCYTLYCDNMLNLEEDIKPNSIDSIVTDPPYELNFMNKGWDNSGVAFQKDTWEKCFNVLKPGGYLLAFGGSRTFHRIACAIEDAGFEIRDTIMWMYGSGFPKSMSISKGIEARERFGNAGTRNKRLVEQSCDGEEFIVKQTNNGAMGEIVEATRKQYVPTSELAKKWDGWGTCLKPSYEPIIVARKPLDGTCIDNVIKYGVGGINIEECRIGTEERTYKGMSTNVPSGAGTFRDDNWVPNDIEITVNGRFPANTILTYDDSDYDEVCGGFPESKGASNQNHFSNGHIYRGQSLQESSTSLVGYREWYNDDGSASRYFYCAKANKKDRDDGLNKSNRHPTVKPTELMQYLIRLVTPNGGTVLDPFNGSGSTGKAAMFENKERNKDYKYIGIELDEDYLKISKSRIDFAIGTTMTDWEFETQSDKKKDKEDKYKSLW